jgi:hypothetical protein
MPNLAPTFQCRVSKQPKKGGLYFFFRNPKGSYGFAKKRMVGFKACAMALSNTLL